MLGEYRLEQKLGGGGFGTVYLAEHIHEHSQVAIKVLQVSLSKKEDFREFLNETRTMIRLRHPHIIPLLDVGLSRDDFPFLVMEYAAQGTLQDRHPRGTRLPLATIAEYVEQIASALQYAHDHRIIHRDVKPENMLLRADGTLLLSDFGIAKIMEQSTLMSMQNQSGTPAYMAPEQHKGYPCFASDQYALAVVAYEWISGTRPFHGSREWLAVQHVTAPLPSLLNIIPTFPPNIEQVLFKALSKEPEQRFATIQEFAAAFRATVQEAPVSDADMQKLPLEKPPSKERLTQQPDTTGSIQTESEISTPPAPQMPTTDQPIEPEILPIRQDPDHMTNPISSDRPDTPYPITHPSTLPIITTEKPFDAIKATRRLFSSRRHSFLLSSLLLIGLIIFVLFISMLGTNVPNPQNSSNTLSIHHSNTPSIHRPNNEQVLDTNTVAHLVKKWAFQTKGYVESSPAVVDGIIYIGSDDGNVYAIDAHSGKKKWAFPTGGSVVSSPVVVNGIVYVGSDDGNVYAIDAGSGQQKWIFPTGNPVSSSPAVADGLVYIGTNDGNLYIIDALSGQQKRSCYTGAPSSNSQEPSGPPGGPPGPPPIASSFPLIVSSVVYISAPDGNLYAIDALSCQQKWVFRTTGSLLSSPAIANGLVYIGSLDRRGSFNKHIYAIDAQSGDQKWVFQTLGTGPSGRQERPPGPPPAVTSSPVVVDGIVYIGADNSNVYAIDAQSGTQKWISRTSGPVVSSPAVASGVIYVGTLEGFSSNNGMDMYAIDAQSGQQMWNAQIGGSVHSSPAVANTVVYVGSADGNVYAFGLPTTPS